MNHFKTNKNAKDLMIVEPDAAAKSIDVDPDRLRRVKDAGDGFSVDGNFVPIQRRDEGEFADKAFYLNNTFDWEFGYDSFGLLVLVPLKKMAPSYAHTGPVGGTDVEGK